LLSTSLEEDFMKKPTLSTFTLCLQLGLSLAFGVAACGGSDDGKSNSNTGGSNSSGGSSASNGGTSSSTAGTSASTAGSTSQAGTSSGGSGTGSSGDLNTGLPDDKPISSLTDAEVADLCSKIDAFYSEGKVADSLEDFSCRFAGMFAAAFSSPETDAAARAACQPAYDDCLAAPSEVTTEKCMKPTGTCTATVGEVEACANDSAKALEQLASAFPSCAELTLADLMSTEGEDPAPADPASCTTVEMKCPDAPMPPSGM
jgi:hypothetical protein